MSHHELTFLERAVAACRAAPNDVAGPAVNLVSAGSPNRARVISSNICLSSSSVVAEPDITLHNKST
jgi:hypothetical protein